MKSWMRSKDSRRESETAGRAGRKTAYYKNEPEYDRVLFLVLGTAAAVALEFQKTARQREEQKKRNRELLFDYSDIVSGLCVYLNAGCSPGKAWERLAEEYREGLNFRQQKEGWL